MYVNLAKANIVSYELKGTNGNSTFPNDNTVTLTTKYSSIYLVVFRFRLQLITRHHYSQYVALD